MSVESKSNNATKGRRMFLFLPLKKFLPYAGLVVGLLMIIFQHSLWSYTEGIVGRILIDIIRFETRGQYTISYEKVRFSILRDQLKLTNFSVIEENETELPKVVDVSGEHRFTLRSSLLSLNVRSFLDILVNRQIQVEGLELVKPSLQIVDRRGTQSSDTVALKTSVIFNLVSQYLNNFKIRELKVTNATVKYIRELPDTSFMIRLSDISLDLNHIEIQNPLGGTEQVILSNQIEFELQKDSLDIFPGHLIMFDKLKGSSRDSIVRVENLEIVPTSPVLGSGKTKANTIISVKLPFAELRGFDPRDIIFSDTIRADHFTLGNGSIDIDLSHAARADSTKKDHDFPTFIFNGVEGRQINLSVKFLVDSLEAQTTFKDLDINTAPLTFDGSSLNNFDRYIPSLGISFKTSAYHLDLPVIEHTLSMRNLLINTLEGYISSDQIEIEPYSRVGSRYEVKIANAQIWGLDLPKAILERNIDVRKILIRNPSVNIVGRISASGAMPPIDYRNIYPIVAPIFPSLKIEDLQIRDGSFHFNNFSKGSEIDLEGFSISVGNIFLDSLSGSDPEQVLGTRSFSLNGSNLNLKLNSGINELQSGSFQFNSSPGNIEINSLTYIKHYPTLTLIGAEKFYATGINWIDLFHKKDLLMDTMLISKPEIRIDKLDSLYIPSDSLIYTSAPEFIDSLHVKRIQINQGELDVRDFNNIRLKVSEIGSALDNISLLKKDKKLYLLSYHFNAENGPFSIELNNENHIITGKRMSISKTDSTLRINQLKIVSLNDQKEVNSVTATIPNILVTGINLTHLLDSNLVTTDQTLIMNPSATLDYFNNSIDTLTVANTGTPKSGIRFFSNNISVLNASIHVNYGKGGDSSNTLITKWLDVNVHKFHFSPETKIDPDLNFLDFIEVEAQGLTHSRASIMDTLVVDKLKFNSDSSLKANKIYTSIQNDDIAVKAILPELQVKSDDWLKSVFQKEFHFDSVTLSRPGLDVRILSDLSKKTDAAWLDQKFKIDELKIDSGKMELDYLGKLFTIPGFSLQAKQFDLSRPASEFYSEDLSLDVRNLRNLMPESLNTVDIDSLRMSTGKELLSIRGLSVDPIFSKLDYGKERGFQTDWINLKGRSLDLKGFDLTKFVKTGEVSIAEVSLDSFNLNIFRDKNIPFPENQVRYMPQKMVSDIPFPLTVDILVVNNSSIKYEELAEEATDPGYVEFTNLTAGISNITNDSLKLTQNPTMLIATNSDFMNSGNLQAQFEFDLMDKNGKHTYNAFLSKMPLTELNKILEPNVNVHVKSGKVTEMKMNIRGNSDYAIGRMQFLYNDLYFNLIGKRTGSTSSMGPAMGSFFANTFIVNRDNPRILLVRNGDIYFERDTTKSIFNYLVKSTLSGVVSSIGARNNRKYIRKLNRESKVKLEMRKKRERIDPGRQPARKEDQN